MSEQEEEEKSELKIEDGIKVREYPTVYRKFPDDPYQSYIGTSNRLSNPLDEKETLEDLNFDLVNPSGLDSSSTISLTPIISISNKDVVIVKPSSRYGVTDLRKTTSGMVEEQKSSNVDVSQLKRNNSKSRPV
jgi:hypothetical protein